NWRRGDVSPLLSEAPGGGAREPHLQKRLNRPGLRCAFMLISSPANERLKHARRVRDGLEQNQIFVEGERLAGECLASETELIAGFHVPTPRKLTRSLIIQLRRRNCPLFEVTP